MFLSLAGSVALMAQMPVSDTPAANGENTTPPTPAAAPLDNLQPQVQIPSTATGMRLTVQDAEALALKNNPQISVYRLLSLASNQITREQRAAYYPNVYGSLTAVEPHTGSRIAAG